MADWGALREALRAAGDSVRYTWDDLEALVGVLPASATRHRTWWSGNRAHVNAWRQAGFTVTDLAPGREVTFSRVSHAETTAREAPTPRPDRRQADAVRDAAGLLLVSCVKDKLAVPAPARDLYTSPLFNKQRRYAELSGLDWFILSAEHGLVAPDEWLAPYERYLPDTPRAYREVWGMWVVERLELLAGPLRERTVEVHAGRTYVDALRVPLSAKGAQLLEPLAGLAMGQRLAWYTHRSTDMDDKPHPAVGHAAVDHITELLTNHAAARSPDEFLARGPVGLKVPGLYSWWVDQRGAADLTEGLGIALGPGLIYAGLAGATRWPSGQPSSNTLWSRITGMHLGGRHEFSTFRRTLGAILAAARHEEEIDEAQLTAWMHAHLKVIAVPFADADTLGRLEEDVLRGLGPSLNLQGMTPTAIRARVTELRRPHGRRSAHHP